jgi:hypothetical protein
MKMSSNEKTVKKQCDVFPIDKKMPLLAEVDADMENQMVMDPVLGLLVLTLSMIVSKQSEIEKSYLYRGPSFSKISEDFTTGRT